MLRGLVLVPDTNVSNNWGVFGSRIIPHAAAWAVIYPFIEAFEDAAAKLNYSCGDAALLEAFDDFLEKHLVEFSHHNECVSDFLMTPLPMAELRRSTLVLSGIMDNWSSFKGLLGCTAGLLPQSRSSLPAAEAAADQLIQWISQNLPPHVFCAAKFVCLAALFGAPGATKIFKAKRKANPTPDELHRWAKNFLVDCAVLDMAMLADGMWASGNAKIILASNEAGIPAYWNNEFFFEQAVLRDEKKSQALLTNYSDDDVLRMGFQFSAVSGFPFEITGVGNAQQQQVDRAIATKMAALKQLSSGRPLSLPNRAPRP